MSRTRVMTQKARDLIIMLALTPPFRPEVFVEGFAGSQGLTIRLIPFPHAGERHRLCLAAK